MIEHNPELERLEVLQQELRQEIDDLHNEIKEIREREKVIRENILRREKLAENAEEIKNILGVSI
jgi:uncharacterized protein (UPF0335 family)